jgi:hypothetical protein
LRGRDQRQQCTFNRQPVLPEWGSSHEKSPGFLTADVMNILRLGRHSPALFPDLIAPWPTTNSVYGWGVRDYSAISQQRPDGILAE